MNFDKVVERVQDTANWVAMARALESERKDALFHDPFARKLAGPEGDSMVRELSSRAGGTWPIVARTCLIDAHVNEAVADGVDAVLNLAAGLDSRPYRLQLPASLTWIEVDHADMIDTKNLALKTDTPGCAVERIALDLSVETERRALFDGLRARFSRLLVITEGLLYYLPQDGALALAQDLLRLGPKRWITDLHNSAVAGYIAQRTGDALQGTAKMQFATDEGPRIFEPLGWRTLATASVFKAAGRIKRLPFPMSLFAYLPEKPYGAPSRPWSGVCVLEPSSAV
jgi:methyltransferase (TIGR00027 family)